MGIVVVFVSQGIISGSDWDFLSERINETLDEAYSRNFSRYVRSGFAEKATQGHAVGSPPLGYRNETAPSGRGARMVLDPDTLPALLAALRGYAVGKHSFRTLAQELNAQSYSAEDGRPFTESSISTLLGNRFTGSMRAKWSTTEVDPMNRSSMALTRCQKRFESSGSGARTYAESATNPGSPVREPENNESTP